MLDIHGFRVMDGWYTVRIGNELLAVYAERCRIAYARSVYNEDRWSCGYGHGNA